MPRNLNRLIEVTQARDDAPAEVALVTARRLIDLVQRGEPWAECADGGGVVLYWGQPLHGSIAGVHVADTGKVKRLFYVNEVCASYAPFRYSQYGDNLERAAKTLREMAAGRRPYMLNWYGSTLPADAFRIDPKTRARVGLRG